MAAGGCALRPQKLKSFFMSLTFHEPAKELAKGTGKKRETPQPTQACVSPRLSFQWLHRQLLAGHGQEKGWGGDAEGEEAKEKESERSARLPAELAPPKPESQPKKARAHKKEKVPDSTKGKSRLARRGASWQTAGMPVQTRHRKPSELQKSRGSVGAIESLYW